MPAVDIPIDIELALGPSTIDAEVLTERDLVPLIQHFPPGWAWVWERGSNLWNLARGVAQTFGRVDALERGLVRQLDPATADFGLEDWERVVGLVAGELELGVEARRAAVLARLRARGGQTIAYWIAFLQNLGYHNVQVTPLAHRFRCGSRIRHRLQRHAWVYALQIEADSIPGLDDSMMAAVRQGMRAIVYLRFVLHD